MRQAVIALSMIVAAVSAEAQYQRTITLSSSTSVSDYQVRVDLTPATFNYGKVSANGSDIRFFDTAGTTPFSYWIETWTTSGTSTIWVKVPIAGTGSFLMRYGTPGVAPATDGTATFIAFEDFVTMNNWTNLLVGGAWDGEAYLGTEDGASAVRIGDDADNLDGLWYRSLPVTDEIVFETRAKMTNVSMMFGFYSTATRSNPRFIPNRDGSGGDNWTDGSSQYNWGTPLTGAAGQVNQWMKVKVAKSGSTIFVTRDYQAGTDTRSISGTIDSLMMGYQNGGRGEGWIDYMFVRRRATIEPTSTLGTEGGQGVGPSPTPTPTPTPTALPGVSPIESSDSTKPQQGCSSGAPSTAGTLIALAAIAFLLGLKVR